MFFTIDIQDCMSTIIMLGALGVSRSSEVRAVDCRYTVHGSYPLSIRDAIAFGIRNLPRDRFPYE